jgi:hypothetical protein
VIVPFVDIGGVVCIKRFVLYSGSVIYLLYFTLYQISDNDFVPCGPSFGNKHILYEKKV